MLIRLCALFVLGAILAPLRAQDGPVKMEPEFCFTFPLAKNGRDVTVKYPVLINPSTVLKPGMVLRTLYLLSYNPDGSSDLVKAHLGNMAQSYSRPGANSGGPDSDIPPELAHEIEGHRRTVWEVPNNFVMAMAQYSTDAMHLIYSPTGKNIDLDDSRFFFFDGLFVGLPDGKVTVLGVEKESKAEAAGMKAGDEILAVGGKPTRNDLATFAAAYASAKDTATTNETASYSMTVRSPGKSEPRVVPIAMPAKIKSSLMDGI